MKRRRSTSRPTEDWAYLGTSSHDDTGHSDADSCCSVASSAARGRRRRTISRSTSADIRPSGTSRHTTSTQTGGSSGNYQARMSELTTRLATVQSRNIELRTEHSQLSDENVRLVSRLGELENTIKDMYATIRQIGIMQAQKA